MVITVTTTVPSRSSRVRNSVKYNPQGKNRRISQADLAPVEFGLLWRRYKRYAFGFHNDVRMNVPRRILRSSDDLDPLHAGEINRSGDVDCDMNRTRIHCTHRTNLLVSLNVGAVILIVAALGITPPPLH
jgi:hypothetical protein